MPGPRLTKKRSDDLLGSSRTNFYFERWKVDQGLTNGHAEQLFGKSAAQFGIPHKLREGINMKRIIQMLLPHYISDFIQDVGERLKLFEYSVEVLANNAKYVHSENIGFGGQKLRQSVFRNLCSMIDFDAIVETGTYIGDGAGYMQAVSNLPVYSCEIRPPLHSLSKMRGSDNNKIHLALSDSVSYLKKLAVDIIPQRKIFFYLDAHIGTGKYRNLPVVDEIRAIATHWKEFVIMIDDFQVPNDIGYRYISWEKTNLLSLELIDALIDGFQLIPYFPSAPASEETGRIKSGYVVLVRAGQFEDIMRPLENSTIFGLHKLKR